MTVANQSSYTKGVGFLFRCLCKPLACVAVVSIPSARKVNEKLGRHACTYLPSFSFTFRALGKETTATQANIRLILFCIHVIALVWNKNCSTSLSSPLILSSLFAGVCRLKWIREGKGGFREGNSTYPVNLENFLERLSLYDFKHARPQRIDGSVPPLTYIHLSIDFTWEVIDNFNWLRG